MTLEQPALFDVKADYPPTPALVIALIESPDNPDNPKGIRRIEVEATMEALKMWEARGWKVIQLKGSAASIHGENGL